MTGTVLCVDPDDDARTATATALRDATGFGVRECGTMAEAIEMLGEGIDCVVTEHALPDGSGLDLLERVRDASPDTAFVLFTDASPDEIDTAALGDAVTEYVPKGGPWARDELVDLISHTVSARSQTAYPLPEDEAERVAALERYADDPEELQASFDRLTAIACGLLDAPMAVVGMIDAHEQEFVACRGIELESTPREQTVCTYAIMEDGVTTIPNLLADPRFEENEAIQAAGLGAYASTNVTVEGRVIGTFCVYDEEPREWTDVDREHLRLLGEEASELLELRHRAREAEADGDTPDGTDEESDPTAAAAGGDDR